MSDNISVTPGSGAIVAAEACSGTANALVQRIKLVLGATDTDGGNISSANPLPVLSGTAGNFLVSATGTVTAVSGTATNLLASVVGTVGVNTVVVVSSGTAANFLAQVSGTVTATGTVTALSGTASNLKTQVSGALTNNNAAPGATNVGALVAIANAAAVTYTEGDQVLLSTDLSGSMRVTGSLSVGGTIDEGTFTEGTSSGTPTMGYYKSATASVSSGQVGVVAMDKWRHLQTVVVDAAGNSRGANVSAGNAMLVDASATVQPVLSGTAANFLVSATGTVTVVSGTAANLLAIVSSGTAASLLSQVSQGTASNLLCTAQSGTAANLLAQVSQGTAANLLTLTTLTAGTNNIGQVISGPQISAYNGTASLTISYSSISFTASAGNSVISAVANKNIYVLGGLIIAQNATNIQFWQNTTASTALTGVMCLAANAGFQIPMGPWPNFATNATNQAVQISSSVATTIGGWLVYVAF